MRFLADREDRRKFCLNKWKAPFRISTGPDGPIERYSGWNFPTTRHSFRVLSAIFSLSLSISVYFILSLSLSPDGEKYHLGKTPTEVAKGTIQPNLATVWLYHSNKHSPRGARGCEETRGNAIAPQHSSLISVCSSLLSLSLYIFLYLFLLFLLARTVVNPSSSSAT